jgi:hypothetical protein
VEVEAHALQAPLDQVPPTVGERSSSVRVVQFPQLVRRHPSK